MDRDTELLKKEFDGTSDRAAVIVGAAYLDEMLNVLLSGYIVEGSSTKSKDLFASGAPLGTFSGRINISYSFGLISKYEHDVLHTIRDIRNKFAHNLSSASFADHSIKAKTTKTSVAPNQLFPITQKENESGETYIEPTVKSDESNLRSIFQETVLHLVTLLRGRISWAIAYQLKAKESYKNALEAHEMAIECIEISNEKKISEITCPITREQAIEEHKSYIAWERLVLFAAQNI